MNHLDKPEVQRDLDVWHLEMCLDTLSAWPAESMFEYLFRLRAAREELDLLIDKIQKRAT